MMLCGMAADGGCLDWQELQLDMELGGEMNPRVVLGKGCENYQSASKESLKMKIKCFSGSMAAPLSLPLPFPLPSPLPLWMMEQHFGPGTP